MFKPPVPAMEFDAFLSYNSADQIQVRELRRLLMARGLCVWFDLEDLRPGQPWQQGLEAGIRGSAAVLVCLGGSGIGPWQNAEMEAALDRAVRDRQNLIPVLLSGAPADPPMPLFLGSRVWVDLRAGLDAEGIDRLVWGITGVRPGADPGADPHTGPGSSADPAATPAPERHASSSTPPVPQPAAGPRPDPRCSALERALEQLVRQYEAALHQSVNSPDAVAAVQAAQQAEAIERRMDDLHRKLDGLVGARAGARAGAGPEAGA